MSNISGYYPAYNAPRYAAPVAVAQAPAAQYAPAGRGPQIASNFQITNNYGGGWLATGANLAHIWNMAKTGMTGGGAVNSAFGQLFRAVKNLNGNGIFNGLKGIVGGALPYAYRSALFEGAISVVVNGYYLATGRESLGQFSGNVVGDTMAGLAGGAGAAVGGALVLAILPFGGMMGTILCAIGGIAGYSVAANMLRGTRLYGTVVGTVRQALG